MFRIEKKYIVNIEHVVWHCLHYIGEEEMLLHSVERPTVNINKSKKMQQKTKKKQQNQSESKQNQKRPKFGFMWRTIDTY